jgi:hypothetical protein
MKMMVIVVVAAAVAACDRDTNRRGTSIAFSPTLAIGAQISPQTLPFATVTAACASGSLFTTDFDLVIVLTRQVNVFMDRVTLHLLDGTNVGGPLLTFPRAQLNAMFGSTLVVGTRAFSFRPQFGCGTKRPRSLVADVILIDADGNGRSVSITAEFH